MIMQDFYYLVRATQGNNVGVTQAVDADSALSELKNIYAPDHPLTGAAHELIEVSLISALEYKREKEHIEIVRKQEAER